VLVGTGPVAVRPGRARASCSPTRHAPEQPRRAWDNGKSSRVRARRCRATARGSTRSICPSAPAAPLGLAVHRTFVLIRAQVVPSFVPESANVTPAKAIWRDLIWLCQPKIPANRALRNRRSQVRILSGALPESEWVAVYRQDGRQRKESTATFRAARQIKIRRTAEEAARVAGPTLTARCTTPWCRCALASATRTAPVCPGSRPEGWCTSVPSASLEPRGFPASLGRPSMA
jgi:hypothetical protein